MTDSVAPPIDRNAAILADLKKVVPMFEPRLRGLRDPAVAADFARCIDTAITPLARGRGAIEIAIGEGLDGLSKGNMVLRLGFASIADHAREWLGIHPGTALKMVRFARQLRDRPLLREAVRAGEISVRQAEAILPVAIGDAEAEWVERAPHKTVRELQAMTRNPTAPRDEEDERWCPFAAELTPEARASVDKALELAGKHLGANSPRHHRMEVICQEYLGAHGGPEDERAANLLAPPVDDGALEHAKEWLEEQTRRWASLSQWNPFPAPWTDPQAQRSPWLLHDQLLHLVRLRNDWDSDFGHMAMLLIRYKAWFTLGFASLEQYCDERLWMGVRTVQQRARLERRLYDLPALRRALCDRRISYEKARLIARYVDDASVNAWIDRATRMTCVALRRALEQREDAQMCARGNFSTLLPLPIRGLLAMALRAAQRVAGRWIPPGEALRMIAEHFIETWGEALKERNTARNRVMKREGGLCQVPFCSRPAEQDHHVEFRSAGGSDEEWNRCGLCAVHHLQCVHNGWIRIEGRAPDQLRWQLGVRPGRPPLLDLVKTPDGYVAVRRDGEESPEDILSPPVAAAVTGEASAAASSLS